VLLAPAYSRRPREEPTQVPVRHLHEDLGAKQKVFVDLGWASHNAMWELNRTLLFEASREWLAEGTVNGAQEGILRMGY